MSDNSFTQTLNQVLQMMLSVSDKVSDLVFSPGRPPQIELLGQLQPVKIQGLDNLTPMHTRRIVQVLLGKGSNNLEKLEKLGSVDLSYSVPGCSRFRANVFMQRGTHAVVMRVIPNHIPTIDELALPTTLKQIADLKNGIVLVTGPTGSGKSSTSAAIIDLINQTKHYHIVTIEDPIEFIHPHKNSTIHQREVYSDVPSFAFALRTAMRQAPKVIFVGELRDKETTEIALDAAENGHLVISTLHTIDVNKALDRIIGFFSKEEEPVIRTRFAHGFRYVISQRLLHRADGEGRVCATEILSSTPQTRECIEKGETNSSALFEIMSNSIDEGMQTFEQVIGQLIRNGIIAKEDDITHTVSPINIFPEIDRTEVI